MSVSSAQIIIALKLCFTACSACNKMRVSASSCEEFNSLNSIQLSLVILSSGPHMWCTIAYYSRFVCNQPSSIQQLEN